MAVALAAGALLGGCQPDFAPSPVHSPEQLRQIDPTSMEQMATTRPVPAILPVSRPATAPAQLDLTIAQARQLALENNLDLRVQLVAPAIARESLSAEEAKFEAVFRTDASFSVSDTPISTELQGSQGKNTSVTPGLNLPLPTGGSIDLSLPMNRSETDNQFSTLNPAYVSDLAASLSLPLLRGAGTYVNTASIRIAELQEQSSEAETRLQVIQVLADVDRAYWRLYAARMALDVQRKHYELAVAQLDRAKRQAKAGVTAEVDVVRAESGVSDQVEAVINAETNLRNQQRELKRIINDPDAGAETPTVVVPTSKPNALPYKLDYASVMALAMQNRMELLESQLQLLQDNINIRRARNAMLPLVLLNYRYGVNGLGADFSDSMDVLRHKHFEDHTVGISVQVPIGNEAARSQLRQAMLMRLQSLRTRDLRMLQIKQEVLTQMDQLEANWQRMIAARNRVVMNARVVDLETRQFQQGLRTSTDVLNAQNGLADAQTAEIAAIAQYQISQVDLAFATGSLLGASRVSWQPEGRPHVGW